MCRQKNLPTNSSGFERIVLYLFLLVTFSLMPQVIYGQTTPEITSLETNKPIERELAGGQKHIYKITFPANQYAKLLVEQRGIDVIVRLLDADGKVAAEYDYDPRNNGEEPVEMTAKAAGYYQLTVEPRQKLAAAGRYEIRIVEMRQATDKEFAVDETRKLITEATNLWRNSRYSEALPLAKQALDIREKELGAENYDVSQALFVLANIYSDSGDFGKGESFYKQALEMREKIMGKDHFSLGSLINNFGVFYKDKGEYDKSEKLLERALEIREKTLDPDHILISGSLLNLANLSNEKGDTDKALELLKRALKIREKVMGPESVEVATILNNMGNLSGNLQTAEQLYLRALAIREKVLGPDHPDVGQTLYNLASLYTRISNYAKAQPYAERSLSIFEKRLGPDHLLCSYPIAILAVVYKNNGDYAKSESLYQRAIAIKEKVQGPLHPFLGGAISNLANLYAVKGDINKALATQARANAILEYNATLNLMSGSEHEKLSYLRTLFDVENQTISLNVRTAPDSPEAANLAVTTLFQRKGRVLDAMSNNLATLRQRFNAEDQALLDKLNKTTAELVGVVLEGMTDSAEEHQKKIDALEKERENLEGEVGRRSAGFYTQAKSITLKSIQAAIPENAALIEISTYRPYSPKSYEFGGDESLLPDAIGKTRYIVYVVRKGEVKWKDLGEAQPIDDRLNLFRKVLRDPKNNVVKQLARAVDEKVMAPIRPLLGNADQLLISADGNLNLIPFEALVDEKNHYLIENYSVTYLTSGRDLLRLQTARTSKSKPLIIANPSFGVPDTPQPALAKTSSRNRKRKSVTITRSISDTYFAPLEGTTQEGRSIQEMFPESTLLTGPQATETALKQVVAPEILHIATHGFFLEDEDFSKRTKIENPLLRSGLALAGANQRKEDKDDGIFTALEASGLNLWGTKLVVLSACDTGLGEVKNGEGVYGLRRAFTLAGTESLVMSLWSVSDLVTRELMTNYYKNLKQGMGRNAALRQVQLEMLKNPNREHPFYWASFIQSGEWANLDGKR